MRAQSCDIYISGPWKCTYPLIFSAQLRVFLGLGLSGMVWRGCTGGTLPCHRGRRPPCRFKGTLHLSLPFLSLPSLCFRPTQNRAGGAATPSHKVALAQGALRWLSPPGSGCGGRDQETLLTSGTQRLCRFPPPCFLALQLCACLSAELRLREPVTFMVVSPTFSSALQTHTQQGCANEWHDQSSVLLWPVLSRPWTMHWILFVVCVNGLSFKVKS